MEAQTGSLLRLRGLPFAANVDDVKDFFADYGVEEVSLLQKSGKPNGEAYVQFSSAEEARRALKERQHEHMGPRYIEIFEALEADLVARSLSAGEAVPSLRGHVVRLRGLPFTSTAQDVLDFFSGVEVMGGEAGVLFTCTPEGRPTGEAYLELASEEGQQAALARHKESIGSRYIEIFQSSKGDLYQAVQQHGFFTAVGGRRKHQWHQQHGGGAGGPHGGGEAAAGGHGARVLDRGQAGVDEMAAAFAGFGFSQRDMQVPGPPRYGFGYASTPDDRHLVGRPSPPGTMSASQAWQQQAAMQQQQQRSMQMRAAMQQQFNPAPGPPGKPGGRSGMVGGSGTQLYDYSGQPTAIMVNPFMVQHPFMMAQQQGSAWAPGMMAAAQQGTWYPGSMAPRASMQLGMAAAPYATFGPGYYAGGAMQRVMAPAQRLPSALHSAPRSTYVPSSTAPGGAALPGSSSHHVRPPSVPPPPAHPPPAPPPPSRIPVPVYLETTGGGQRNPGQQVGNGTEGTGRQEESRPWQQHDSASSPPLHEQGSPVKLLGDGSPQPPSEQQQERTDLQPSGQARQQEQ